MVLLRRGNRKVTRIEDAIDSIARVVDEGFLGQVRLVLSGTVPTHPEVGMAGNRDSADSEVIKFRSQENYARNVSVHQRMLRRDLRNHAVGGEDLENVQSLQDGSRQGDPCLMLQTLAAGNASVRRLKRDQPFDTDFLGDACEMPTPFVVQLDGDVGLDRLFDWSPQFPAERVSLRVELMPIFSVRAGVSFFRQCIHIVHSCSVETTSEFAV